MSDRLEAAKERLKEVHQKIDTGQKMQAMSQAIILLIQEIETYGLISISSKIGMETEELIPPLALQQTGVEGERWVIAEPYSGTLNERDLVQVTNQPFADVSGFSLNTNGYVAYNVERWCAEALCRRLNSQSRPACEHPELNRAHYQLVSGNPLEYCCLCGATKHPYSGWMLPANAKVLLPQPEGGE